MIPLDCRRPFLPVPQWNVEYFVHLLSNQTPVDTKTYFNTDRRAHRRQRQGPLPLPKNTGQGNCDQRIVILG